jgi:hypothetical protein
VGGEKLLEISLSLPARPPDRNVVKMKLLSGEDWAPRIEGRGILFLLLKAKVHNLEK